MYQSSETRSGPSQASKINLFWEQLASLNSVVNYFCQKYHRGCLKASDYTSGMV